MKEDELKNRFIVGANVRRDKLEELVIKALKYCVVAEDGTVHISTKGLGAKIQIKLVLAARSLAAALDDRIRSQVTVDEIEKSTGLPDNQIRARANELVREKFATSQTKGSYAANQHKIDSFLDSLKGADK
jgi:hypothetical protein